MTPDDSWQGVLGFSEEKQSKIEDAPDKEANKNYNNKGKGNDNSDPREGGSTKRGGVADAVKLGGWEIGNDGIL